MRSTSPTGLTNRIKKLPPKKRLVKFIGSVTFRVMSALSVLMCSWSIKTIGGFLGSLFYIVSKRYRNVAINNLTAAFGNEKSQDEIRSIAKEVFKHFSREAMMFFKLLSLSRKQVDALVDIEGSEHLDKALAEGKGCIILTGHYGNWELMARKFVIMGYPISVIARDSDDPGMTGITTKIREKSGYQVFDKDQPIIGAFRKLKNNECLGILPDQNDYDGIFVNFFGRPAKSPVGPAVLSLKSGAPIVPAFTIRLRNGKYRTKVHPQIEYTPTGDYDKDVHALLSLVASALEREIRTNLSQWLWLHDRWKLTQEAPKNEE